MVSVIAKAEMNREKDAFLLPGSLITCKYVIISTSLIRQATLALKTRNPNQGYQQIFKNG